MRAFRTIVFVLALIPTLTGPLDWVLGAGAQHLLGSGLDAGAYRDPVLNSELRFFGALWFGVGPLMMLCLTDLTRYGLILKALLGAVFLAGIGRAISIATVGLPANPLSMAFVLATTGLELVAVPLLVFWQMRIERGPTQNFQAA